MSAHGFTVGRVRDEHTAILARRACHMKRRLRREPVPCCGNEALRDRMRVPLFYPLCQAPPSTCSYLGDLSVLAVYSSASLVVTLRLQLKSCKIGAIVNGTSLHSAGSFRSIPLSRCRLERVHDSGESRPATAPAQVRHTPSVNKTGSGRSLPEEASYAPLHDRSVPHGF